jgi:hypothetical protein
MPEIRTDDTPRRLRAVWLGPRGKTLSWEWTYVQWALCLLLITLCSSILFAVLWPIDHVIAVVFGTGAGAVLGVRLAGAAVARTNYDQPLRWWRRAVIGEWRRSSRPMAATTVRLAAPRAAQELGRWAQMEIWGASRKGPAPLGMEDRRRMSRTAAGPP